MAQNQRYNGLPLEDPLDHLDIFERLCRTVKMNGVPEDAIKMILFPFSLGNKASQWEKNVPSDLVSTWEDVKKEFVNKFYPKQKTAKLRNDITSFKQGAHENLYEAWDRLKDYQRKCPHHGVSKENLLGIFYRGALEHYRRSLDTASYGCFANLTAEQGEQLIENLAQSEECYGGDYDRTERDQHSDNQRYKELNDKLDKLSKVFLANQKSVNYVGEAEVEHQSYQEGSYNGIQGMQAEVNYVGGYPNRPFNQNYGNNNLSYRSNNVENPQDQYYPPRAPQGNQFQPRPYGSSSQNNNAQWRPQGIQNSSPTIGYSGDTKFRPQGQQMQNAYPPAQASEQDDLKSMMRQIMEGQAKAQQDLTEKMEKLERKIDSNHGEAQAKFENIYSHLKTLDNQVAQVASSSQRPAGSLPGKSETNPKAYCNTISLGKMLEITSTWDDIDMDEDFVQLEEVPVEESQEIKETSEPMEEKDEEDIVMVSYECSSIIEKTLPKKLADPGSFTLPCAIGSLHFPKSLCDLGSSVNLMPLSVAKKIGVTTFQKCRISLVLADRSVRIPVGIIENLPLRVGGYDIPTDFVVLEMDEEPVDPLILGRPFLATARALIDCERGKIELRIGESVVKFNIKREVEKSNIGSQCFLSQSLDEKGSEMDEDVCTDDLLKAALIPEKEDPWSELKAPKTELKQLPPDKKGKAKAEQKGGVLAAKIDRSPAIDRSIPPWRSRRQQLSLIDPLKFDHPPDNTTMGESSKQAGKRIAVSPTKSINKKNAKMRIQRTAPTLKNGSGEHTKAYLADSKDALVEKIPLSDPKTA